MQGGWKIAFTERFNRDFKGLPPELQEAVRECIRDFAKDPIPASRRAHRINAKLPKVFSVDVTSNKAYKLSFHIEGDTAMLRRVGTHREIDRNA